MNFKDSEVLEEYNIPGSWRETRNGNHVVADGNLKATLYKGEDGIYRIIVKMRDNEDEIIPSVNVTLVEKRPKDGSSWRESANGAKRKYFQASIQDPDNPNKFIVHKATLWQDTSKVSVQVVEREYEGEVEPQKPAEEESEAEISL